MTVWRTRIACWITKASDTHSEYVTLAAFPQQQWLHGRALFLRYAYIACFLLSELCFISSSSSPLCLRILKEGSRVRQKHSCLGIVFIAAIATTCFGRAWPSSGHNVDAVHK
jgi:hypothetical protein